MMKKIQIKGWLAMDTDGTLRLHRVKPTEQDHDERVRWWLAEDDGQATALTDSWEEAKEMIGTVLAGALCDYPMQVSVSIGVSTARRKEGKMKKIMFNDRYGLTNLVLEGKKTQTRRRVMVPLSAETEMAYCYARRDSSWWTKDIDFSCLKPAYEVGEVVAVAQRYCDIADTVDAADVPMLKEEKGWHNKMFVKAEYMPHKIVIKDRWIERIQDINDKDCMREGIQQHLHYYVPDNKTGWALCCEHARECFAQLITRVSGKGMWEDNPFVWVYEFELAE